MRPSRPGSPRVIGFMQARDQWPLLGVSVTHALANHVDCLTVLLHRTTDESAHGLGLLREVWGERLTVLAHEREEFVQEAITNSLIAASGVPDDAWVYVLDADEFLVTPPARALGDILADLTPEVEVVRYEVHNWVAPRLMDSARVDAYRQLTHRAVPTLFGDLDDGLRAQEIMSGAINFFDVPFPSKVIVRAGRWVTGGTHSTRDPQADNQVEQLPPDLLRAAHLPYASRSRLANRVRHGELLARSGFGPGHGWQNQMMRQLDRDGALDSYWQAHTLGEPPPGRIGPRTARDDGLARALNPSLEILLELFGPELSVTRPAPATPSAVAAVSLSVEAPAVSFDALVGVARRTQLLHDEHEAALAAEKEVSETRLTALQARLDVLRVERDEARAEGALMMDQRETTRRELTRARDESKRAVEALDQVVGSRSWRLTAGLRRAAEAARARGKSPDAPGGLDGR